ARADPVGDAEVDVDPMKPPQDLDVLAKGAIEPIALEVGGAQLQDQRAKLVERLAGELAGAGDLLAGPRLVSVEQGGGGLGGEDDAEELLTDDVVELERHPVSLRQHRELAAALIQPRVGYRNRGVGGEQLDQLLIG